MNSQVVYVLLVEDDIDYSALLRRRLMGGLNKESRQTFVVAQTGLLQEAADYVAAYPVDVIVLDLNLPDTTGINTLLGIRTIAPDAAIIVLTGRDNDTLAEQAIQAGAQDYLVKGNFNTELLVRTIRYAQDRKQTEKVLCVVEEQLRQAHGDESLASALVENFDSLLTKMAVQNSLALAELGNDNPARVHVEKLHQSITLASDLTRRLFNNHPNSTL
ncbi:MAG: response regulator transcription factor [Caldilineaceae bacterium]